jgi:hypothetical protein
VRRQVGHYRDPLTGEGGVLDADRRGRVSRLPQRLDNLSEGPSISELALEDE